MSVRGMPPRPTARDRAGTGRAGAAGIVVGAFSQDTARRGHLIPPFRGTLTRPPGTLTEPSWSAHFSSSPPLACRWQVRGSLLPPRTPTKLTVERRKSRGVASPGVKRRHSRAPLAGLMRTTPHIFPRVPIGNTPSPLYEHGPGQIPTDPSYRSIASSTSPPP